MNFEFFVLIFSNWNWKLLFGFQEDYLQKIDMLMVSSSVYPYALEAHWDFFVGWKVALLLYKNGADLSKTLKFSAAVARLLRLQTLWWCFYWLSCIKIHLHNELFPRFFFQRTQNYEFSDFLNFEVTLIWSTKIT